MKKRVQRNRSRIAGAAVAYMLSILSIAMGLTGMRNRVAISKEHSLHPPESVLLVLPFPYWFFFIGGIVALLAGFTILVRFETPSTCK